ncbi:MAG TPA: hypothetical protein VFT31_12835 [Kribbella sp.]|nr:hypothetical protein [Kribbella sp.]
MRRVATLSTVALSLILGVQPALAYGANDDWMPPRCDQVTGDGSVTFTWNDGNSLARTSQPVTPATTVSDVDVLSSANRLLSVGAGGRLSASDDAGCTWAEIGRLDGQAPFMITPAPDGSAYVWTKYDEVRLYRVVGAAVTELKPAGLENRALMALVAAPSDPRHVRVVDTGGVVLDSTDGGLSFKAMGGAPTLPGGGMVGLYDAAVAPTDLDRVVVGTVGDGAFTSADGGRTWTQSAMGAKGNRMNVFTASVSAVDPSVVWVMGLDIAEHDSGASSEGRHIYRSTDGGQTFRPVVDHEFGEVTLTNGLLLVPHPTDPSRVYFEFGSWFLGYGTDLFSYDAMHDRLTKTHNPYDDVTAIAFSPRFPTLAYLGLSEQR